MIPIFKPSVGIEEIEAISEVLKSGWIGLGPKTKEFENKFADYVGAKYAVAVNSGTSALDLALRILKISPLGSNVITTPLTFVSTSHIILFNGLFPNFVDIEEDILNIDPNKIENNITPNTKAIIPVHYGGHPCDMDKILKIADENNLIIIEDAAHACGASYTNQKIGSIGDMTCFSFHAIKNLTTGDGGMITTDNKEYYEKLLKMRWLGVDKDTFQRNKKEYSWRYDVTMLGRKMHMNDINASIGLVQLQKLDKMNQKRKKIAEYYNNAFKNLSWLTRPVIREYVQSSYLYYVIRINERDRDEFIKYLLQKGISSGVHYLPLYLHSYYKKLRLKRNCPITDKVWKELVTLPLYPDMTAEELIHITESVKNFK